MSGPDARGPLEPIDQALRDQPEIVPSPAFADRVMRSVRREAADRAGLPFPWHLAGGGLVVAAALTAAALTAGDPAAPTSPTAPPPEWLAHAVAWPTASLAGGLGLARFFGRRET